MKYMVSLFCVVFLSTFQAQAAGNDPFADAVTTSLQGTKFSARAKSGFHFNQKAPNLVIVDEARVKPNKLEKQKVEFVLPKADFAKGHASLYVCDDAETVCVPKTIDLKGSGKDVKSAAKKKTASMKSNKHGFIEDDLQDAMEVAKKENKLVLVDFSARWCPGCIRLESEVFDTKSFKQVAEDFVKVKLDFDRFETQPLKEKYGIWAIPTLMVLTANGDEVARMVDYEPMSTIQAFIKDAKANPVSFTDLKARADRGNAEANAVLGRRLYMAAKYADAVPYLAKVSPAPIELLDAKVQAAKKKAESDPKAEKDFQKILADAIHAEPTSSRSIVWRTFLLETLKQDPKRRAQVAAEGTAVADDLLAHAEKIPAAVKGDLVGEFTGYERMFIASERADMIEAADLGDEETLKAYSLAADVGKELKIPTRLPGPSMRYLIFLSAAQRFPEAEAQAKAMLKRDPGNAELHRRLLKIYNGQKKFADAIALGKDTLAHSYGKNEVWVAQQLAKAYASNGQKLEAKALAQNYLNRSDIEWSHMKSEQKDLASY